MYKTYCFFKQIANNEYYDKDLSELSDMYQHKDLSELSDKVIAVSYVKIYGIAKRCLDRYYSLDNEEKTALVLDKLIKALETYTKEQPVKFTSYYYGLLNRSAQDAIAKKNHTYDIALISSSLDALKEMGIEQGYEDIYDSDVIIERMQLSDMEKQFCQIVMEEPHKLKITEIAEQLGVSRYKVYEIIKKLQPMFKELVR